MTGNLPPLLRSIAVARYQTAQASAEESLPPSPWAFSFVRRRYGSKSSLRG